MDFDLVIVGAGLVGSCLALALKDSGLKLAVVENHVPPPPPKDASWDSRIYAISPGSAALMESSGVWGRLDSARITPVHEMQVFGDDGKSRLVFSAYEAGVPELAFIVENRLLQDAMMGALNGQENLAMFCPAKLSEVEWSSAQATLRLADETVLRSRLLVGADGADSWVREKAGIGAAPQPYRQMGVVANFVTEKRHRNIAWQWFRVDGVLALLPLPGERVSLVWSAEEEQAKELLSVAPDEFCRRAAEASHHVLGGLQLITPPAAFPLRMMRVATLVKPRLALIGDAAHNIHPLAGQGVNLGFRDARELASVLVCRGAQSDCGDFGLLRRYERARREDILTMQITTDALQKLFNNALPGLPALRNFGLRLTDGLPVIKSLLMQHALG